MVKRLPPLGYTLKKPDTPEQIEFHFPTPREPRSKGGLETIVETLNALRGYWVAGFVGKGLRYGMCLTNGEEDVYVWLGWFKIERRDL